MKIKSLLLLNFNCFYIVLSTYFDVDMLHSCILNVKHTLENCKPIESVKM